MKHTVRSKDGELVYPSFREVERAWLMGLIDPEDEIQEHGTNRWRKAGALPLLRQARRKSEGSFDGPQVALAVVGIGGGSLALWLLAVGQLVAGGIAAVLVIVLVTQLVTRIARKRKPHG